MGVAVRQSNKNADPWFPREATVEAEKVATTSEKLRLTNLQPPHLHATRPKKASRRHITETTTATASRIPH